MRMATVKAGTIVGIVNHDGEKDHPYGDVEFLGPLPDNIGVEWVGKSAKSLQEQLDKDKPTVGERVGAAIESGAHAVAKALEPNSDKPMTAAELLAHDKAGDLKYFTFVKEAKRILGKDYPESEEKPAIVKALEKVAKADAK